jgi:F-type H+-transporting ATPase subunit b
MDLQLKALLTQVVGFLIVVWLLKKYAWSGMLEFMEKRREKIAAEFEEIEKTRADADALKARFDEELADIEHTRRLKIQEAVSEANSLSAQIKEEARQEAVELRAKANRDIEMDLDKANAVLRDRMADAVITTAEKIIRERLDDEKHKQLINEFLKEVNLMEGTNQ